MALQLGALRDALLSAGAPVDKADKPAEEVSGYEGRFSRIEADLAILKWMAGFNLALTAAVLGKLLFP
jgi:hypothetical protein